MSSHSVVSQHLMEPEGSLPRSQELSTCTNPEPDQSIPQRETVFLNLIALLVTCLCVMLLISESHLLGSV
jgi:hypothetical protein